MKDWVVVNDISGEVFGYFKNERAALDWAYVNCKKFQVRPVQVME